MYHLAVRPVSFADVAGPQPAHLLTGIEEIFQGPLCLDATVFEHHDLVGAPEHGMAVGDDEAGRGILDFRFWILDWDVKGRGDGWGRRCEVEGVKGLCYST